MRSILLLVVVTISTSVVYGHPAYQHHFNKIVESNPCLKQCMEQATTDNLELSILKTANISNFIINVRQICSTISTARECISRCQIDSNPFALESMTSICSDESLTNAHELRGCLMKEGSNVYDQCTEACGNYDEINNQVHEKTKELHPESNNDQNKVKDLMHKVNDACGALKCSNRCSVKEISARCGRLDDGRDAGDVLRQMIEKVLMGQRRDLEKQQLVETLAKSVPIQCNYLYQNEVMFDAEKDQLALAMIDQAMKREQQQVNQRSMQQRTTTSTAAADGNSVNKKELTMFQMQAYLMQKQWNVLQMQEKNLRKESRKLDMELSLLEALKDNGNGGSPYQPPKLLY